MTETVEIPYGCYWSTPFARWQGSFASLHAIEFAAQDERELQTEARMVWVRSDRIETLMSEGIEARCISASRALEQSSWARVAASTSRKAAAMAGGKPGRMTVEAG